VVDAAEQVAVDYEPLPGPRRDGRRRPRRRRRGRGARLTVASAQAGKREAVDQARAQRTDDTRRFRLSPACRCPFEPCAVVGDTTGELDATRHTGIQDRTARGTLLASP
jgi:hypothetical protein